MDVHTSNYGSTSKAVEPTYYFFFFDTFWTENSFYIFETISSASTPMRSDKITYIKRRVLIRMRVCYVKHYFFSPFTNVSLSLHYVR